MIWHKKSEDENTYIKFYIGDGDLKIEFNVDNVLDLSDLVNVVFSGTGIKKGCVETICKSLSSSGFDQDAELFKSKVIKKMKPSEYQY